MKLTGSHTNPPPRLACPTGSESPSPCQRQSIVSNILKPRSNSVTCGPDGQLPGLRFLPNLTKHSYGRSTAHGKRTALAAAAHDGKLFAIGGMQEKGGPTTATAIYDPATDKWTEGPALVIREEPKSEGESSETGRRQGSMSSGMMTGFGASAFATGGHLYVTTVQGTLQRLSDDASKWESIAPKPTGRFFHRLLPLDDRHLIVVGGSNMSVGKYEEVEILSTQPGT